MRGKGIPTKMLIDQEEDGSWSGESEGKGGMSNGNVRTPISPSIPLLTSGLTRRDGSNGRRGQTRVHALKATSPCKPALGLQTCLEGIEGKEDDIDGQAGQTAGQERIAGAGHAEWDGSTRSLEREGWARVGETIRR